MVDRLAVLAKLHLASLLRSRNVKHLYDPAPGDLTARVVAEGHEFTLDKFKRAFQPYRDIHRFLSEERVVQFIIGPGLLPVVTSRPCRKTFSGRMYWSRAESRRGTMTKASAGISAVSECAS